MKRFFFSIITSIILWPAHDSLAATFRDVPEDYWASGEIAYLVAQGVVKGTNDQFRPNDHVKRIQAAEMIVKALHLRTTNRPNPHLKDMNPNDYGYEYVAALIDEGIMSGHNGYFKPQEPLTRGQMAKILTEAFQLDHLFPCDFRDLSPDDWTYHYVASLTEHSIATGYTDGTFRPNATVTRAQFAVLMARALSDEWKRAILWQVVDAAWDEQGALALRINVKNNFLHTVDLKQATIAVVGHDKVIAEGSFTFTDKELYLQPNETTLLSLSFDPSLVYTDSADWNEVSLYVKPTWQ